MACETTFTHGACMGGHKKFQSCLDEAIYWVAVADYEGSGDPDYGHAALADTFDGETYTLMPGTRQAATVSIPAGYWIVWQNTMGAVSVTHYDTAADQGTAYAAWVDEFKKWDDQ